MSDQDVPTDIYTVEKLVSFRYNGKTPEWRVRWQGYGPKDDTWETRTNLLMDNTFAFKQQMEDMEREYLARRGQGRLGRGASRAAAKQGRGRKAVALSVIPEQIRETVSDSSSSSSSSEFSCPKQSSSSISSSSTSSSGGGDFASDSECSIVGPLSSSSPRNKGAPRMKRLRRQRRCIDDLFQGGPANGAPRGVDPGLPASSDSELGPGMALQAWTGKVGGAPYATQQGSPGGAPRGTAALLSPGKKTAAWGDTPLRCLRLAGLEAPAQTACRSEASGAPSGAPSSSWKSSPEAEAAGGPGAPTGFTINEPSDEEAGPPFLPGGPLDGVRGFAPPMQQNLQHYAWGQPGGGPPVSASLFHSPSSYGIPAGGGASGEGPGWPGGTPEGERLWSDGGWARAVAASGGPCGPPSEIPFRNDAAVGTSSTWGMGGGFHGVIRTAGNGTPSAGVDGSGAPIAQSSKQGAPHEYASALSCPSPRAGGPPGTHQGISGAPAATPTTVGTTQLTLLVRTMPPGAAGSPRGPTEQATDGATAAGPIGSSITTPEAPEDPQSHQKQQYPYQQHIIAAPPTSPLGMSKGMLNRYPCESLFPGRVRVVKIVRGESGTEGGVKGGLVHYVIAASPGTTADPSRNVWGTCSIPDARRFCPGALCDYLLRKALFKNGDKHSQSRDAASDSAGPPISTENTGMIPGSVTPPPDHDRDIHKDDVGRYQAASSDATTGPPSPPNDTSMREQQQLPSDAAEKLPAEPVANLLLPTPAE